LGAVRPADPEDFIEKAVVVVHRHPVHRRRCWWRRGRRVCHW
jgi:hypothetical protein